MEKVPLVIIGGGIVGLSLAKSLSELSPGLDFVLLEKEAYFGEHTSSRNSGVLHAGLYYPETSLKHRYCLEGLSFWSNWSKELSVPINSCGKFIVAGAGAVEKINCFYQDLTNKRVPGIRWASENELRNLKEIGPIEKAVYSANSKIIGQAEAINSLVDYLERKNKIILKHYPVNLLERNSTNGSFRLTTKSGIVETAIVVNCAGLYGIELRKQLGLNDLENYFLKGHYFKFARPLKTESLIYPLPESHSLGIHLTRGIDGATRFGPDAQKVNDLDYCMNKVDESAFFEGIKKTFSHIDQKFLTPDYCGIRPKLIHRGNIYPDFWIEGPLELSTPGYFEFCGIESPGFTAAPAMAMDWAKKILRYKNENRY